MKFSTTFEDGVTVAGDLELPDASLPLSLATQLGLGPKLSTAFVGKVIARSMLPRIAASLLPLLPPAPRVVRVGLNRHGRVTATESASTPTPAQRAAQIALKLEPVLALHYQLAAVDALLQAKATSGALARLEAHSVPTTYRWRPPDLSDVLQTLGVTE